jgi:hypothetical protein
MQIPVKVKATGEIVDVTICVATAGNPLYTTSGGVTYLGDDIEPAEPDWQHYRIQAAIAVLQGITPEWGNNAKQYAEWAVQVADALIAELKRSDDVYAECRRMDAINTASVCENMTKIQNELQKKGGEQ